MRRYTSWFSGRVEGGPTPVQGPQRESELAAAAPLALDGAPLPDTLGLYPRNGPKNGPNPAPLADLSSAGAPGTLFGFNGRPRLGNSGLLDFRARVYDPETGRFLNLDPIGTKDGLNRYGYVHGDPVNMTDPSGTTALGTLVGGPLMSAMLQGSGRRPSIDRFARIPGRAWRGYFRTADFFTGARRHARSAGTAATAMRSGMSLNGMAFWSSTERTARAANARARRMDLAATLYARQRVFGPAVIGTLQAVGGVAEGVGAVGLAGTGHIGAAVIVGAHAGDTLGASYRTFRDWKVHQTYTSQAAAGFVRARGGGAGLQAAAGIGADLVGGGVGTAGLLRFARRGAVMRSSSHAAATGRASAGIAKMGDDEFLGGVISALRASGSWQGATTAKLLREGKVKMWVSWVKPVGKQGKTPFGSTREFFIYPGNIDDFTQAAGVAAHETRHVLQRVPNKAAYHQGHEFEAYVWSRAADSEFHLATDDDIWIFIRANYPDVPPPPAGWTPGN